MYEFVIQVSSRRVEAEVGLHRRQRDVHDRGVEDQHELAEQHRDQTRGCDGDSLASR